MMSLSLSGMGAILIIRVLVVESAGVCTVDAPSLLPTVFVCAHEFWLTVCFHMVSNFLGLLHGGLVVV